MRKLGYEYLIGKTFKDEKRHFNFSVQLFGKAIWMRQYTVAIAVKLVPVLKSLTSSQPHDTTSMVHVQELPQRNMNLPESILIKRWGCLLYWRC